MPSSGRSIPSCSAWRRVRRSRSSRQRPPAVRSIGVPASRQIHRHLTLFLRAGGSRLHREAARDLDGEMLRRHSVEIEDHAVVGQDPNVIGGKCDGEKECRPRSNPSRPHGRGPRWRRGDGRRRCTASRRTRMHRPAPVHRLNPHARSRGAHHRAPRSRPADRCRIGRVSSRHRCAHSGGERERPVLTARAARRCGGYGRLPCRVLVRSCFLMTLLSYSSSEKHAATPVCQVTVRLEMIQIE